MPRLIISRRADNDLRAIIAYISEHGGKRRARNVKTRIDKTVRNVALMPRIGRPRPYLLKDELAFPVRPWTVVYRLLAEGDGIFVKRILDGRRDLPDLLDP